MKGWNSSNIWKQPSLKQILFRKKLEQMEVRECSLFFGAESFVFWFAIKKI